MIKIVKNPKTDDMGLGHFATSQVTLLDKYISHNPMYFGLFNLAGGKNNAAIANGLQHFAEKMEKEDKKIVLPYYVPHPIYFEF